MDYLHLCCSYSHCKKNVYSFDGLQAGNHAKTRDVLPSQLLQPVSPHINLLCNLGQKVQRHKVIPSSNSSATRKKKTVSKPQHVLPTKGALHTLHINIFKKSPISVLPASLPSLNSASELKVLNRTSLQFVMTKLEKKHVQGLKKRKGISFTKLILLLVLILLTKCEIQQLELESTPGQMKY